MTDDTQSKTGGRWGRIRRLRRPPAVTRLAGRLAFLTWRRAGAAAAVLLVAAFVVGGLYRARVQTGIDSFLPAKDPTVTRLNQVGSAFGGDPIVVLLESGKPREFFTEKRLLALTKLEGQLASLPDVATVYGPGTLLNQIAGQAQDLITELIGRRDGEANLALVNARNAGKSEAEAEAAKQQVLDQFAARYGPLIIQGLPSGLPTVRNPDFVQRVVFGGASPRPQWHFVVPSNNSVAILVRPRQAADGAAVQRLVDAVRATVDAAKPANAAASGNAPAAKPANAPAPANADAPGNASAAKPGSGDPAEPDVLPSDTTVTVSGVPAVVAALAAEAKREGPLLGGLALLAVALCFWFVPWTRRSRRLVPLATTIVAIGITLAIFGWLHRPLSIGVVAFLSVVLGIGCYYPTYFAVRARVRTVLTVACATSASLATLVVSPLPMVRDLGLTLSIGVLLSALLGILARRLVYRGDTDEVVPAGRPEDSGRIPWRHLTRRRQPLAVFAAALLVAALGWAQLPRLSLETNVEQFASGLPALNDAQHVEQVIGSSGELDVVLSGVDVTSKPAVEWMDKAEAAIVTQFGDQARRVLSVPMLFSFLGQNPTPEEINSALRLLPQYLTSAVISLDRGTSVMAYGVKADDLGAIERLRDGIQRTLPPLPPQYQAELSGLPIVAARGQELVSSDRLAANLLGVFAAGLVLAIGLRRRWDALRAVAAAVLATGGGLFLLWLTGTALSPITVALGSLTAAVGCEFTVLLSEATWRRNPALRRAVLLVTATSVVGYAVLVVSGIAVVREFGVLLAGAVLLALLSSLCVVRLTSGPVEEEPRGSEEPIRGSLQEVR